MEKDRFNDQHLLDYLALVAVLLAGCLGYLYFGYQRGWQLGWVIATGVGYVVWGVIHHLRSGDFHWEVVIEYGIMAVLGVGLVATIVW